MLTTQKLQTIENWIYANARPVEKAKWNVVFNKGTKDELVCEMLKYQNDDGGFGNGFEADILTPESAAIPSAEAIFMAQDYDLDLTVDWAKKLYKWFENTAQDTPSFWEGVPKSIEDYPHAPWWGYSPDTVFTPNPCAVVASAMLLHGTDSQKELAERIAEKCIDFLMNNTCMQHDIYCLQRLIISLQAINSPLITEQVMEKFNQDMIKDTCLDESKYLEYVTQPLDFVYSPKSQWYNILKDAIPGNLAYWERTLSDDGCWQPNFSWGVDTDTSHQVTKNWSGYIAVKRVKILKAFA